MTNALPEPTPNQEHSPGRRGLVAAAGMLVVGSTAVGLLQYESHTPEAASPTNVEHVVKSPVTAINDPIKTPDGKIITFAPHQKISTWGTPKVENGICAPEADRTRPAEIDIKNILSIKESVSKIEFIYNDASEVLAVKDTIEEATTPQEAFAPAIQKLAALNIETKIDAFLPNDPTVDIGSFNDLELSTAKNAATNFMIALAWTPVSRLQASGVKQIYIPAQLNLVDPGAKFSVVDGLAYAESGIVVFRAEGLAVSPYGAKGTVAHELEHLQQGQDCRGLKVDKHKDNAIDNLVDSAGVTFKPQTERTAEEVAAIKQQTGLDWLYALDDPQEFAAVVAEGLTNGKRVLMGSPGDEKLLELAQEELLAREKLTTPSADELSQFAVLYSKPRSQYLTPAEILNDNISPRDYPQMYYDTDTYEVAQLTLDLGAGHQDTVPLRFSSNYNEYYVVLQALDHQEFGDANDTGWFYGIEYKEPFKGPLVRSVLSAFTQQNTVATNGDIKLYQDSQEQFVTVTFGSSK